MTNILAISTRAWHALLLCLLAAILFFHVWQLDDIPQGFYIDESSIGYNAALIAEGGRDEHGKFLPVFFESFGEYKSPLYIYVAAGLVKIFGASEFSIRFASFIFFALFLAGFYVLIRRLFPQQYFVQIVGIYIVGTLPWFFSISRIAFEVISQLGVVVWALVFLHRTYEEGSTLWPTVIAGSLLGLSLYTYSSARLLTLLMIASILLVYRVRRYWRRHAVVGAGFFLVGIPYLFFILRHPEALTHRFREVTYLYDSTLSLWEKAQAFLTSYLHYISPEYLFWNGDSTLRHHPGMGGELFWIVGILAIVGMSYWLVNRNTLSPIWKLFAVNLLCAPVAAALTTGDSSLRSILIPLYLAIFAVLGCATLLNVNRRYLSAFFVFMVAFLLLWESRGYLWHYFQEYPTQTIFAFESFDFEEAFIQAASYQPTEILVSNQGNNQYAHMEFYKMVTQEKIGVIPVSLGYPIAAEDRCVITTAFDDIIIGQEFFQKYTFPTENFFTRTTCFYR